MIILVARKELKTMFSSPVGWIILGAIQLVFGTYFTVSFNQYFEILSQNESFANSIGITQFICEGVFGIAAMIMLFSIPVVSMNLISEEKKRQTLTFLMSAPISMTEIVVGKFIGIITFFSVLICSLVLMVLVINLWTDIDIGYLMTNAFGLWLLVAGACAIGLFYSCHTSQPILAGFFTLLTLIALLFLDKFFIQEFNTIFQQISMMQHYKNFAHGMVQSYDLIYFLLITSFFILLAIRKLNAIRLYG